MSCTRSFSAAAALILAAGFGAQAVEPDASESTPSSADARQLVSMPAEAQQLLRKDMVDHMVVLNQLYLHLAASEFREASELAEARLGKSSMGRHRGTGMGPGRFMPREMHQLGISMHLAASEFATIARSQDVPKSYAALQRMTSFCVACHVSFRIR